MQTISPRSRPSMRRGPAPRCGSRRWASRPRGTRPCSRSRRPTIGVSIAASFELPPADALPATPEAQALAEIKLDLAILKYARFARGGRLSPSKVSALFDQTPPLRDPKTVLAEIEAADAPDAYFSRSIPSTSSSCACARRCSRRAVPSEEGAKPADNEQGHQAASSSTWSAGAGCRRTSAASMSGTTRPRSCSMWSRTGRRSSPTRPWSAPSATPRRCSPRR